MMGLSNGKRYRVLRRDGFTCQYCGATPPDAELEVDHIYPQSKGGADDMGNLITACSECNRGKTDKVLPGLEIKSGVGFLSDKYQEFLPSYISVGWADHGAVETTFSFNGWEVSITSTTWDIRERIPYPMDLSYLYQRAPIDQPWHAFVSLMAYLEAPIEGEFWGENNPIEASRWIGEALRVNAGLCALHAMWDPAPGLSWLEDLTGHIRVCPIITGCEADAGIALVGKGQNNGTCYIASSQELHVAPGDSELLKPDLFE